MNERLAFLLTLTLLTSTAPSAAAPISEKQAVAMAISHNPDLRAALLDLWQAHQTVRAEEDLYAPVLQIDAGVTHTASPSLSSVGSGATSTSDAIVFGQQLSKVFPWGTSASLRLEQSRFSSTSPAFIGSSQGITLGPGYRILGRLIVAQPLLRGSGTDVGQATLRAARLNRTIAQRARDHTASTLLRGVLIGYWELWFAGRRLAIERSTRQLAQRALADAKARLDAGADAPLDLLPFEGRIAELDESVLTAELSVKQKALDLARLLGKTDDDSASWIAAAPSVPVSSAPLATRDVVTRALAESHEVRQLHAQVTLAQDRVKTAGEANRARLDLEGYVQTEGLGNRTVGPAVEQFGKFGAVSAHVGLVFDTPIFSSRRRAEITRAKHAVESARARLRSARQRIETDVRKALLQERTARRRLKLALRTKSIRHKQLAATQARFKLGSAISIEIREAEESLRRAKLRVTRARVDVVLAALSRAHYEGELLLRYPNAVATRRTSSSMLRSVRPVF